MFPLLREGKDEVAVYPCKAESLKPMDVVLFSLSWPVFASPDCRDEGWSVYYAGGWCLCVL